MKFYPSLLARVLESMETLLTRPYGCGEQTISSTYPNLLFLRALKNAHPQHGRLEARAMKNLLAGYRRLLGYQDSSGGFTYWGHGDPDVALTAYALSFLHDAKDFVTVDEDRLSAAQTWLAKQPAPEASTHALQLHALALVQAAQTADIDRTWDKPETAKTLRFESECGPDRTAINQPVTCGVLVSRPSFRGYGMVIAEIGLPPGAEVDRGTLANVVDDSQSGTDSFEVAPDHVTFYIWPHAADSRFHFVFRPRFAMTARSAQSVLYDYYNPDERVVLAPKVFTVEEAEESAFR